MTRLTGDTYHFRFVPQFVANEEQEEDGQVDVLWKRRIWTTNSSTSEGQDSQAAKNLAVFQSQNMDRPLMRM